MTGRAFLGITHTPLLGLNPITEVVERELRDALDRAQSAVAAFAPELVILIAPDHYNGFFNELMPPFCVGTQADSVGDYLTPAGRLNVHEESAVELVEALMDSDFDVTVSRRMRVDHGFAQPLQLMFGSLHSPPVIPIFLNAVAAPGIPRMRRCRAIGEAIGRHFRSDSRRILFIGSGGLSHEPPVPTLSHPDPAVRERITVRQEPTQAERDAKTQRVMAAGRALAAGDTGMKPLNAQWDQRWIEAMLQGTHGLDALCKIDENSITNDAGLSAHESKTWLVARSALGTESRASCELRHYQPIPEYIAGFGLLMLNRQN